MASMLKKELRSKLENYRAVAQARIINSVIRQRTEDYLDRLHSEWSKGISKGEVRVSTAFVNTTMKSCWD